MSSLSQQASAVEAALRVLTGAARKPSTRERDHIVAMLKDASVTLRNSEFERAKQE